MAILYGTTGDGTTLPVLVDQFGNLLAKGIEGEPGPPGPPGIGQLPPDPYEGAILGWEDGELAWLGGSVPLPAGTYGPYTYIDSEGRLDIPQDASSLVNGQQLYMSDFYGDEISAEFSTDTISSVAGNVLTFPTANNFDKFRVGDVVQGNQSYSQGFTGQFQYPNTVLPPNEWLFAEPQDANTEAVYSKWDGSLLTWTAPSAITASNVRLVYRSINSNYTVQINGQDAKNVLPTSLNGDATVDLSAFGGELQSISYSSPTSADYFGLKKIFIDGFRLLDGTPASLVSITAIDDTVPSITVDGGSWCGADGTSSDKRLGDTFVEVGPCDTVVSKVMSGSGSVLVATNGAIVLRANNREWADDFYVTAPEQRIAARKVASAAIRRKKK